MSWHNFVNSPDVESYLFPQSGLYLTEVNLARPAQILAPKPAYIVCKKCNSNQIWIDVQQVRSGDEGSTSFFTCHNCKAKWSAN